jgi:hypothetical protein
MRVKVGLRGEDALRQGGASRTSQPARPAKHTALRPSEFRHKNAYPSFHERLTLAWIAAAPFLYSYLTDCKPAPASAIPNAGSPTQHLNEREKGHLKPEIASVVKPAPIRRFHRFLRRAR